MGNHNSGRHPNPQGLRDLKGDPNKARHNHDEPKPPSGDVVKPAALSKVAEAVWDRLAPLCIEMRTLTAADVETFKTLCELQATLDLASSHKNAPGFAPFTLSEDYNGAPKMGLHAAIKLEKEFATVIRPYYDYFGMTPFGRAKIRLPKKAEPVSKWAALA